jgi:DNA (cytosine-5)-methyltransferase 1
MRRLRAPRLIEEPSAAMGIDWMEWDELREAIPPAYSEFIGRAALAHLQSLEAAA